MARPISEAQRAAYQRNAEKSTGPPPAPHRPPTGPRPPSAKPIPASTPSPTDSPPKSPSSPSKSAADFEALRDGFLQDFTSSATTSATPGHPGQLPPHPPGPRPSPQNRSRPSIEVTVEKALESTTPGFVSSPLKPEMAKPENPILAPTTPASFPRNSARLNHKCFKIKILRECDRCRPPAN